MKAFPQMNANFDGLKSLLQTRQPSMKSQPKILWIDGVGGFSLVEKDEVIIGQAIETSAADVCIVGDLSRQAGVLRRTDGDYLLQPLQQTQLNERSVDRAQLLHDRDIIQFGNRVKLRFAKPNPLSSTARLDLLSVNRFSPSVDAILLLADSCILGASAGSHVVCPHWTSELVLFKRASGWFIRSQDTVEVNGSPLAGQFPLESGLRVCGADFSLSIE